jgi:hypothetical protein
LLPRPGSPVEHHPPLLAVDDYLETRAFARME